MSKLKVVVRCMVVICLGVASVRSETLLTDPFAILKQHFEANGGLERLRAEQSQYVEGTLAVAGLSGSIKIWTRRPHFQRTEVDLTVLRITQGENENSQWVLDANGKVQQTTKLDEAAKERREVKRLFAEYDYADPNSANFLVSFAGIDTIVGAPCYVIKIANELNADVHTSYINAATFLLEKSVALEGQESNESTFSDYRDIAGIKVAHRMKQIALTTGQAQEITITRYDSNPAIELNIFDPPNDGAADFHFTAGSASENIPFKFLGNHLFIPVTVSGIERWWVLDTGASMTVLDRVFAEELKLELQGNMKGQAVHSTVDVQFTNLPPFQMQGIKFDGQTVAVIDMTELNKLLEVEVSGILGFDFLSRFVTKVDYAAELVSFYNPATFSYTGLGRRWDIHIDDGTFTTQATLDGVHTGTWLLDLGASHNSLTSDYAIRQGFAEKRGVNRLGRGAGQSYVDRLVRCDSLSIAGLTVKRPIISYAPDKVDTVTPPDEIGALGNTLFRHFVIYVDYAGEQIFVEPGANFGNDFPEDRSGLLVARDGMGGLKVVYVAPETPAAYAGLREGDAINSIDGKTLKEIGGLAEFRDLMSETAGKVYSIGIMRDGGKKTIELKLANLF